MRKSAKKAGKAGRADSAHDADGQIGRLEGQELLGLALDAADRLHDLGQARAHQLAEIGQMGEVALAAEQQAADLVLELLDGAAQGGLGDIAGFRRPREVQGLADRQKIPDVMQVHGAEP